MDDPTRDDGRDASPQASVVRSGSAAAPEVGRLGKTSAKRFVEQWVSKLFGREGNRSAAERPSLPMIGSPAFPARHDF